MTAALEAIAGTGGIEQDPEGEWTADPLRGGGWAGQRTMQRKAATLWYMPAPALVFTSLPFLNSSNGGPNGGFCWAIQRVTFMGFGAATDSLTLYRGYSAADVQPQNALNTLTPVPNFTAAAVNWAPGRTEAILMPDQALILAGTVTSPLGYLSWDVIQLETWRLADFLE